MRLRWLRRTAVKTRKNACDLDMALESHEIEPALELLCLCPGDQAGLQRQFRISGHPAVDLLQWPAYVGIFQQGNQVIGDRPPDGILEVDDYRRV